MNRSLPYGWAHATIGELFSTVGGGTPATDEPTFWGDGVPWITSADIDDAGEIAPRRSVSRAGIASSATTAVPSGSVIVVTRVGLGKVALVRKEVCFSQDCQALLFDPALIDSSFVAHELRSIVRGIRGRGTTIAGVTVGQLRELPFTLPPFREQLRIVEATDTYLSRLDDAVESLERAQAKLKAYRSSVLKAAVEGRLVPTEAELARTEKRDYEPADGLLKRILAERRCRWEESELKKLTVAGKVPTDDRWKTKYLGPRTLNESVLPRLPEGWCWASLDQLGDLARGKSMHRPRNDPRLLNGPYPFVQTGDVKAAETWIRAHSATYSEFGLRQSRLWPAGTLCITIAANIAATAILSFEACFPDSVVGFHTNDFVTTRYVEMFMRTARQNLEAYAPATAQKNINLETLVGLAVPVPPLGEQQRIVDELDRALSLASASEATIKSNSHRIDRLRQAILEWAFEGKLVDQDPNDEPADKLLERIRSERTATTSTKNTRSRKPKAAR